MWLLLLNKFLLGVLLMSLLNIGRHIFFIVQVLRSDSEDNNKYTLTKSSVIILGLSVTYILVSLITGVSI